MSRTLYITNMLVDRCCPLQKLRDPDRVHFKEQYLLGRGRNPAPETEQGEADRSTYWIYFAAAETATCSASQDKIKSSLKRFYKVREAVNARRTRLLRGYSCTGS